MALAIATLVVSMLAGCASTPPPLRPEPLVLGERLINQGVDAFNGGNYISAISLFQQSLAHYRSIDHMGGIIDTLINLADTHSALAEYDEVESLLSKIERVGNGSITNQQQQRITLLSAANALSRSNYSQAESLIQPLLPLPQSTSPFSRHHLSTLIQLARAKIGQQRYFDAKEVLKRIRSQESLQENFLARLLRLEAEIAIAEGDLETADADLQSALELYRQLAFRPGIAATLQMWADVALQQQKIDLARDRLGRALYIHLWIMDRNGSHTDLSRLCAVHRLREDSDKEGHCQSWQEKLKTTKAVNWTELQQLPSPY